MGAALSGPLAGPVSPTAIAAAYFVGSLIGLSLPFPGTDVSIFWTPNAILLAGLLVTPRARWWIHLLAVFPAHLAAQELMGLGLSGALINYAGNAGEALLGAWIIERVLSRRPRVDRLEAVTVIMIFGGGVAPAVVGLVVSQLLALAGSTVDPWTNWGLRLLVNALAVFILVPPLVLALRRRRQSIRRSRVRWAGEAGAVLIGLLASSILLSDAPHPDPMRSLLLFTPLPFVLWPALRFGLVGASLSQLGLAAASIGNAVRGHGPFIANDPTHSAASLMMFLNVICIPGIMLAAWLEERSSRDDERRAAETLHGAVLASMHHQLALLDSNGVICEVNASWAAAGRTSPGTSLLDELRRLDDSTLDQAGRRMLEGIESVLRGESSRFQTEVRDPSSSDFWLEVSVEGLQPAEGGALLSYTDITSRKRLEEETRLQRQEITHLTRVSMLGELSVTLAHELNQPLTAILSNAQAGLRMMAREPVDLAQIREILSDIADDDRRAGEVIQRLRAMLKKGKPSMTSVDVNELAREVLHFAHGDLITRNVRVTTQLAHGLPPVLGDRVQLQQVLLNLILNGCEAMSANAPRDRLLSIVTAVDEQGILVSVGDTGTGIAADELERMFEPFFSTKPHGLGLGLAICRSIVEAHGGRLWASNNHDRGATIVLTLPAFEGTGDRGS